MEAIKEDFGTRQFYSGGSGREGSEEDERGGEPLDTDWPSSVMGKGVNKI